MCEGGGRRYGCLALITGTAVYEVTSAGQDRTVPLRFTTGIPPKQ